MNDLSCCVLSALYVYKPNEIFSDFGYTPDGKCTIHRNGYFSGKKKLPIYQRQLFGFVKD